MCRVADSYQTLTASVAISFGFIMLYAGCVHAQSDWTGFVSALNSDTVWSTRSEAIGGTRLDWTRGSGEGRTLWVSEIFTWLVPEPTLVLANDDETPDLWLSFNQENVTGAVLFLGMPRGEVRLVYNSDADGCLAPELTDVDGDGHKEIIHYSNFGFEPDQCTDFDAMECSFLYPVDWIELMQIEGYSVSLSRIAYPSFYEMLANRYRLAAVRLQTALDERDLEAAPGPHCNTSLVRKLSQMADMAQNVVQRAGSGG